MLIIIFISPAIKVVIHGQQVCNGVQLEIEQFLIENLNEHRKGLLGKTVPIGNMLSWTKASKLLHYYHCCNTVHILVSVLCCRIGC